jgi:hypothetical protein
MRYFDRVCKVDISPDISFSDLKIRFEIRKDIEPNKNTSKVDIYNLLETTRNRIPTDKNGLVRIQAGYSNNGGLVEIGVGNISSVRHYNVRPDIVTTILCKDGFNATRGNLISLSFKENTPLYSIIDRITSELNLPVRFADYDRNTKLKGGFSFIGALNDCMDILSQRFKFTWSIQDNQLQIIKQDNSTGRQIVLLSVTSGLLSEPEEVIIERQLAQGNDLYEVTSLLQPQIQVGDLIAIDSKALQGNYIVKRLVHTGDTRGTEWYTKMQVTQNA